MVISLLLSLAVVSGIEATGPKADPAITSAELEAHVRFLASDELKGRKSGTPENKKAAEYLAGIFERAGLEPAGDDGTFLQKVPMERIEYTGKPELHFLKSDGETVVAEWGVDFDMAGGDLASTGTLILTVLANDEDLPDKPAPVRAFFLDGDRKQARAWTGKLREPGAAGMLLEIGRSAKGAPKERLPRSPRSLRLAGSQRPPRVRLRGEWIDLARSGEFVSVSLEQPLERTEVMEHNVVAKITGVGTEDAPEIAKQTLVYSAHFDHIGVSDRPQRDVPEEEQDLIRNGADDDASGVAAVLELAQAYAAAPKPARTLVFLLATGEEIGLLGTEYYLDHPAIPLKHTVCNLNFEMIGRPDDLVGGAGNMWLTGYDYSTLADSIEKAGVSISPDARPDQHFFKRSDNYAFVRRGIVGQTLSTYNMHQDYHRPSDEADALDYGHMETCVRAAYKGFSHLVDGSILPAWREGIDPDEL